MANFTWKIDTHPDESFYYYETITRRLNFEENRESNEFDGDNLKINYLRIRVDRYEREVKQPK
ncbi:MAG: hypothetical protein HC917_27095 [Richelia sp. SM2_1_7]|nr:hypothetical protein [Richelia sp. SM2_1_7]